MGTFAQFYKTENALIPANKREEFAERVEKLFQAGGMMDVETVNIKGRYFELLRGVAVHDGYLDCTYNYKVVFAPDKPESNQKTLYWGRKRKHELSSDWIFMPREKKRNPARQALRRYLALMANPNLRREVFGF